MRKGLLIILFLGSFLLAKAQVFYSEDTVSVVAGTTIFLPDTVELTTSSGLYNNGIVIANSQWNDNGESDTEDKGDLTFSGSTLQEIKGNGNKNYYNVTFNNTTAGTQSLTLNDSALNIYGTATLTDGIIGNGTGTAIFQDGSAVAETSDASFFSGEISKIGADSFVFPIGASTVYRPATIKIISGSQTITANYLLSNPDVFGISKAAGIDNVSKLEYWTIVGATSADIALSWNSLTSGSITAPVDLVVVGAYPADTWHSFNGKWHQGTAASGNVTNDSTIGDWSLFTLGSLGPSNFLPTDALVWSVRGNSSNQSAHVKWLVQNQSTFKSYRIERSEDLVNWQLVDYKNSNQLPNAEYDLDDFGLKSKVYYYKLFAETLQGEWKDYGIQKVDLSKAAVQISLFLNPANSFVQIEVSNAKPHAKSTFTIYDLKGKLVAKSSFNGSSRWVNLDFMVDGLYFIRVDSNKESKVFEVLKLTK